MKIPRSRAVAHPIPKKTSARVRPWMCGTPHLRSVRIESPRFGCTTGPPLGAKKRADLYVRGMSFAVTPSNSAVSLS